MRTLDWPPRRTHDRFCCDGLCNVKQGRGGCPRYAHPEPESLSCRLRFIVGLIFAGFIWMVTR